MVTTHRTQPLWVKIMVEQARHAIRDGNQHQIDLFAVGLPYAEVSVTAPDKSLDKNSHDVELAVFKYSLPS